MNEYTKFEYKGYRYVIELDKEWDNVKMFHYLYRPDGSEVNHERIFNHTPYREVPEQIVIDIVEWDLIGD